MKFIFALLKCQKSLGFKSYLKNSAKIHFDVCEKRLKNQAKIHWANLFKVNFEAIARMLNFNRFTSFLLS